MEQEEITQDEYHMLTERLREVNWEIAMEHNVGWAPYGQDLRKEKVEIIKKLNTTKWQKQAQ
tara:strand:+ start:3931 stop:4116 length:186 start_codon:yes stop_codon:yes gene_type:complete